MRFLAGSRGEFLWIESADIRGIGFGPTRSRVLLGGDGKLGVRFAIGRKKSPRIAQSGLALPVRIDSSGDLAFLDSQVTGTPDARARSSALRAAVGLMNRLTAR